MNMMTTVNDRYFVLKEGNSQVFLTRTNTKKELYLKYL